MRQAGRWSGGLKCLRPLDEGGRIQEAGTPADVFVKAVCGKTARTVGAANGGQRPRSVPCRPIHLGAGGWSPTTASRWSLFFVDLVA